MMPHYNFEFLGSLYYGLSSLVILDASTRQHLRDVARLSVCQHFMLPYTWNVAFNITDQLFGLQVSRQP